jgi:hypothetical protein
MHYPFKLLDRKFEILYNMTSEQRCSSKECGCFTGICVGDTLLMNTFLLFSVWLGEAGQPQKPSWDGLAGETCRNMKKRNAE